MAIFIAWYYVLQENETLLKYSISNEFQIIFFLDQISYQAKSSNVKEEKGLNCREKER